MHPTPQARRHTETGLPPAQRSSRSAAWRRAASWRDALRVATAFATLFAAASAVAGPTDVGIEAGARAVAGSLVAGASRVTFRARDPVGGFGGAVPIASASVRFDPLELESVRASVDLDPSGIETGNVLRDANAVRAVLEVARYPNLHFRLERVAPDAGTLPEGASSSFEAVGDLTLHGVTATIEMTGTAARSNARLVVDASFPVTLTDFHITPPSFLFLTVDDRVDIFVHLVFDLATPKTSGD